MIPLSRLEDITLLGRHYQKSTTKTSIIVDSHMIRHFKADSIYCMRSSHPFRFVINTDWRLWSKVKNIYMLWIPFDSINQLLNEVLDKSLWWLLTIWSWFMICLIKTQCLLMLSNGVTLSWTAYTLLMIISYHTYQTKANKFLLLFQYSNFSFTLDVIQLFSRI